jgi:hypothetical protein
VVKGAVCKTAIRRFKKIATLMNADKRRFSKTCDLQLLATASIRVREARHCSEVFVGTFWFLKLRTFLGAL